MVGYGVAEAAVKRGSPESQQKAAAPPPPAKIHIY